MTLKGKGIVCQECIEADKKLGRRAVEDCICYPDDSLYTCVVCGREIRQLTEDETFVFRLFDAAKQMTETTRDLFHESLKLVNNAGLDIDEAFEITGFTDAWKAERGQA
jgi:hypothetical protein